MRRIFLSARALAVCGALLAVAPAARANGRLPVGRYLVGGTGTFTNTLALQATFGVLISTDNGASWRWTCEEALGFSGVWDPALTFTSDGALHVGVFDGVTSARGDYCTFTRAATSPMVEVLDLSSDPEGTRVAAALQPLGMPNGVALSDDRGATWHSGWLQDNFLISTVDIAPGHPDTMYATGFLLGHYYALFRSTDGGMTFTERSHDFHGGINAYIAGVDPNQPDTVYVRAPLGGGGWVLLRSDDGGATLRELVRTRDNMLGVGFAPDGMRMWVGSANPCEGILHSSDGGQTWRTVNRQYSTLCMRYHAGRLYVCGDPVADGFIVAASTDDGATFTPLLRRTDLRGPEACATGTGVRDQCTMYWPAINSMLSADAGPPIPPECPGDGGAGGDASDDAGPRIDASSAGDGAMDATGSPPDAGSEPTRVTGNGCGACSAAGHARGASGWWWAAAIAAAAASGARRRSRRRGG